MEYFFVFIIAIIFAYLADKYYSKTKIRYLFLVLAILPLVLMAALRAHTIGIDVDMYITPTYDDAKTVKGFTAFINSTDKEYAFWGLQYLVAHLFGTLFSVHFVNQLIIILPIVLLMCYVKEEYNTKIWQMYALYLFLQYNISLCIIRQNVAFSLFLLGYLFLLKKKYPLFIIFTGIAGYSHNSTIIPIICFCILYFTRNFVTTKKAKFILILGLVLITLGYNYLITNFGFLIDDMYISRMEGADKNSGGYLTLAFNFVLVILPFLMYKKSEKGIYYLNYIPAIGLVLSIIARNSVYIGRLAIPFMIMTCITVPVCLRKTKWLYNVLLLVTIIFWYITYIDRGLWGTYPYVMDLSYNMF